MIFDKLCSIAERHLPDLIELLKKTRIFIFEGDPHKELIGAYDNRTDEEMIDIYDNFSLPYNNIAIEDNATCIVLIDTQEDQLGLGSVRLYLEAIPLGTKSHPHFGTQHEFSKEELDFLNEAETRGELILLFGKSICKKFRRESMSLEGGVDMYILASKRRLINHTRRLFNDREFINNNSLQNVIAAYHEIIYFNRPNRFVLQQKPAKIIKPKKNKILRSHQRPIYTILKPDQIREKMGLKNPFSSSHGFGKTKRPHERRRHWRHLSDDIYSKNEDGEKIEPKIIPSGPRRGEVYYKKVLVPNTWVGPSQNQVGNKIYKVMLNI